MNSEEYLGEVLRVLRENFRSNDPTGGMPVATVAHLVRRAVGVSQMSAGFLKFKDALQVLETRGEIRTAFDSKGALAIWLPSSASPISPSRQPPRIWQSGSTFPRLRGQVWLAFVSESPPGRRFLHRSNGDVRVGLAEAPAPEEHWIEIEPIDAVAEKQETQQFLKEHEIEDPSVVQCLDSSRWYVDLPVALAKVNPAAASEWKRSRSSRVIAIVQNWCATNNIDRKLVLEHPRSDSTSALAPFADRGGLKQLLLAALQRMTAGQLLDLPIPPRYLVAVLRPELMDT